MLEIKKLSELSGIQKKNALAQVEKIFFTSSSLKEFSSPEKRAAFHKRWCGDYQTLYPEEFFIALENDKVLGYMSGCSDSNKAAEIVEVPGFKVFQDLFKKFPAHLHINFHPDARGKGLGSILVENYKKFLRDNNVVGVHLVTSVGSQNISFYERLQFSFHEIRELNSIKLYFMGCILE
ncbi:MAG: GNAT family N-acetyltransferase [Bacteriovorax sp.]|nr:GNAT family N-acetyltransferase [Bacteriovorax sp.]